MSEIKINVNDVITSSSIAKQQLYEIQNAKSEISRLQSQLSMDVKSRYNISEQINRLIAQFDALYNDTSSVISTIESSANYYNQTENQLIIKAYLVGQSQNVKSSTMADNVGWIDDARGDKDLVLSDAELKRIIEMLQNGNTEDALVELGIADPSQVTEEEKNHIFGYLESLLANSIQEGIETGLENADDIAAGLSSLLAGIGTRISRSFSSSTAAAINTKISSTSVTITNGGNAISKFLKTTAGKVGISTLGGIIDCALMIKDGEDFGDAAVKATIHVGVGTVVGAVIGSIIPGPGTAAGAVVGTLLTVAVSTGINYFVDNVYDDAKNDVVDTIENIKEKFGNAKQSSWWNLSTVFG